MPPPQHSPSPAHAAAPRPPRRAAGGFTLVEVLVALLVLSLGVLGVVALQAGTLRVTRESRLQEAAVRLASEFTDLVRSNPAVARQTTAAANPYLVSFNGTAPSSGSSCFTASACADGVSVARRDVDDWAARVAAALPGARVAVCFDSSPFATGRPDWDCDDSGDVMMVKIGWTQSQIDRSATTLDKATRPSVMVAITPKVDPT